jgi:hypothetical protein
MIWVGLAAAAALFAGSAHAAMAEHGDTPFRLLCEEGSYLTGFEGHIGAWIDKVTIRCAKWNAKAHTLEGSVSRIDLGFAGRSGGGDPVEASCPSGSLIAGRWSTRYTTDGGFVLHTIGFNCTSHRGEGWGDDVVSINFGSDSESHSTQMLENGRCGQGTVATGIEGRSGEFVDDLRIICGNAPVSIFDGETKVNPRAKYKNPAVGGTKVLDNVVRDAPDPKSDATSPPPAVRRRPIP